MGNAAEALQRFYQAPSATAAFDPWFSLTTVANVTNALPEIAKIWPSELPRTDRLTAPGLISSPNAAMLNVDENPYAKIAFKRPFSNKTHTWPNVDALHLPVNVSETDKFAAVRRFFDALRGVRTAQLNASITSKENIETAKKGLAQYTYLNVTHYNAVMRLHCAMSGLEQVMTMLHGVFRTHPAAALTTITATIAAAAACVVVIVSTGSPDKAAGAVTGLKGISRADVEVLPEGSPYYCIAVLDAILIAIGLFRSRSRKVGTLFAAAVTARLLFAPSV